MTHKSIKITIGDFLNLLNRFRTKCYNGEYEKIQYNIWRELNRYARGEVEIHFYYDGLIQIDIDNDAIITSYAFDVKDKTFGSFLYKEMTWDEIDKNIIWYDYDGTCATKTDYLINTLATSSSNDSTISSSNDSTISINLDHKANKSDLDALEKKVQDVIDKYENNNNNNKENKNMKNFNFDFGPMNGNVVRMSMYGLAVKDKTGSYVSYDAKNGEIMNVDIINFDGSNFLYKMPVAIKDISIGDIVIHQNIPMFVVDVSKDNKALVAVDPVVGERKEIMLARSPFGFNFATKVVNILGNAFGAAASADNPFGNMWMLLAMNESSDMNTMLPMMMLAQGGAAVDPATAMMAMVAFQKDTDTSSMLPMFWLMNNQTPSTPTCTCGCTKD